MGQLSKQVVGFMPVIALVSYQEDRQTDDASSRLHITKEQPERPTSFFISLADTPSNSFLGMSTAVTSCIENMADSNIVYRGAGCGVNVLLPLHDPKRACARAHRHQATTQPPASLPHT